MAVIPLNANELAKIDFTNRKSKYPWENTPIGSGFFADVTQLCIPPRIKAKTKWRMNRGRYEGKSGIVATRVA